MFTITMHKGFHMQFANGYKISVQWGPGNYCDTTVNCYDYDAPRNASTWEASSAEIAIFGPNGEWTTKEAYSAVTGEELWDDVIGHVSADDVAKYIAWCIAQ